MSEWSYDSVTGLTVYPCGLFDVGVLEGARGTSYYLFHRGDRGMETFDSAWLLMPSDEAKVQALKMASAWLRREAEKMIQHAEEMEQ